MYKENIEKIFADDIREKKKAGTGAFHMRGKGVKHGMSGALRTASYFMKTKEKKKLNGEVTVFNMYSTILPFNEFELKDEETQRNLLTKWREIHSNTEICEKMELTHGKFHGILNNLNVPKKSKTGGRTAKKRTVNSIAVQPDLDFNLQEQVKNIIAGLEEKVNEQQMTLLPKIEQNIQSQPIVLNKMTNGLNLSYNGTYDADQLNKILTKLQLLIDGETNKFKIALTIYEDIEE